MITILRPNLSSISVQNPIQSGSQGKIIVRLSGFAPEGGVTVRMNSSRPSVLPMPSTIYFAPVKPNVTIHAPAAVVNKDVTVKVTATYRGMQIAKLTVVRKSDASAESPTATATATATEDPVESATE